MSSRFIRRLLFRRLLVPVIGAFAIGGCSLSEQEAPNPVAPSEFGLSITLTATPDTITQDGESQAAITATVRDAGGRPRPGVTLGFAASATGVSFTEATKVSDQNGVATTGLIAPAAPATSTGAGSTLTVIVTPVGDNFQNTIPRTVDVRLLVPSGTLQPNNNPVPAFTIVPVVANINQDVTFDASATQDENVACGDLCTYRWDFGDFTTDSGRVETHRYSLPGSYTITLTVVDARGGVASLQRTLTVNGPAAPTARFTVAPSSPAAGATVTFNGSSTTVGAGATISQYAWDFGEGGAAVTTTVPAATNVYEAAGTYLVTLTVTDSLGRQHTTVSTVTVVP